MNQLEISVGGRSFVIACQPGDEAHVTQLAGRIDQKFQQLAPRYSQNLLFATLQLADDLHRAQADWATAREEADTAINGNEDMKREANLALGQQDKYLARIAELETELGNMQSTMQQEGNKHNDLMADNDRYKIAVMESDAEITRLSGELATATRERDAFEEKLRAMPEQSDAAAPQSFFNPAMQTADPDLAPSLERFADLLEACASKLEGPALEGKAGNS